MQTTNFSTSEKSAQFQQLQNKLRQIWQSTNIFDQDDYDILVVPSFSIDQQVGQKVPGFLHYEERLLFSLIRLRNPQTRLIYVTAQPMHPLVIDYYLQLLPGIPFSHARDRLLLLTTYDNSFKPLTQKILERPRLVERIKGALRSNKSYMVCFNSTALELELSLKLGIPLLGCNPDLLYWGTKSGSREIFASCNIPHPDGSLQVFNVDDLIHAADQLWLRQPTLQRIVIKLNEGFSGEGNAILDLKPIIDAAPSDRMVNIALQLENLRFQAEGETWASFSKRIPELGAIVEAFVEGEEKRSPSVQGYISPNGEVEILSTHEQILGGADNHIYLGCSFPADAAYRLRLHEFGLRVGKFLAEKGAIERYGVDFLALRTQQGWDIQAIEINLRKGGTTHPFMILKLLTNGHYDYSTGLFYSPQQQEKYYIATDNLHKPAYRGLLPIDLMDIIAKHRLHFDSSSKTGNVFHLIGALSEFGKVGLTSIGNSPLEAQEIYNKVESVLDFEAENIDKATKMPINW